MSSNWDPANATVLIQKGGPGNPIKILSTGEVMMDALSGGGRTYESDWAGTRMQDYRGTRITANPARVTGNLNTRLPAKVISDLEKLARSGCLFSVVALTGCQVKDRIELQDYDKALYLLDTGITNGPATTDNGLVQRVDPSSSKIMLTTALDGALTEWWLPVQVTGLSGGSVGVQTAPINDVIIVADEQCQGPCGNESDGTDEIVYVTDAPGGGYTAPRLVYNGDGGNPSSDVSNTLTTIADGDAVAVSRAGQNLIIAATGTNGGVYYADLDDAKAGTAVGVLASGIASGTAVNDVHMLDGVHGLAVGQGGVIWKTTNGGTSWSSVAAAGVVTSENLLSIAGVSAELAWIGGANGALIRVKNVNGTVTAEVITVSGVSDDVNAVAVPPLRTSEVYLGTSGGEIHRTRNGQATAPTFEEVTGLPTVASSSIAALAFAGIKGNSLYIVQTNGSSQSRILLDRSGGAGGVGVVKLGGGSFTAPVNSGLNAIAATFDPNIAYAVGEVSTTYAGIVKAQA